MNKQAVNIQEECMKIHHKFATSEMANYKIQLLFDSEIEKVKKEYEEKLRWIPVTEKMPENLEWVDCKSGVGDHYIGCYLENYGIKTGKPATITHWRSFL